MSLSYSLLLAQPLHWVYQDDVMVETVSDGAPEFHVPPANPFYRLPCGASSCYGDEAMAVLQSLVDCKGEDMRECGVSRPVPRGCMRTLFGNASLNEYQIH